VENQLSGAEREVSGDGVTVAGPRRHDRGTAADAIIKLSRAHNAVMSRVHRDLAGPGLTFTQFAVLEVLFSRGPMCQKDIARKILSQSSGNMTVVIDHLEHRGLVEREKKPDDRRTNMVSLTLEGRRVIGEFLPHHLDVIAQEFAVLSPEELKTLAALLKRLGLAGKRPVKADSGDCIK